MIFRTIFAIILLAMTGFVANAFAFLPAGPESEYLDFLNDGTDPAFCAEWNPEFVFRGYKCCSKKSVNRTPTRTNACSPHRRKGTYCDEMTVDQKRYIEAASAGRLRDMLTLIQYEVGRKGTQAYCGVNNGFLAWGRPIIASPENRIRLRAPQRCTNFGTDEMIGLLEWLGRQVAAQYTGQNQREIALVVGDISAPRGGCLSGRGGRRGHRSHTAGQDVDLSFLLAKDGHESPVTFHKQFDAKTNWWLLKKLFKNPLACVQVIFLDKTLIRKLAQAAKDDPDWQTYRPLIKHVKGHRNHFHIRIGSGPGQSDCGLEPGTDILEEDEEEDEINQLWAAPVSRATESHEAAQ